MHTLTTQVPDKLALELNKIAQTEGRSKSWIIKEALTDYLERQKEVLRMTLEGLDDIKAGRIVPHEQVVQELQQWGTKKKPKKKKRD